MDKKFTNSDDNTLQFTNIQDHKDHKNKGIYLRDDHCDWGSSGMNEFTNEYSESK